MSEPELLVVRLLDTADIEQVVPRLPPDVLHRLIDHCGLEACGEIVALASPRQLQRLLDLDVWRAPAPGGDAAFDGDRFGEWLEMLAQLGPEVAAERLAAMDIDLVVAGLSHHLAAYAAGAVAGYTTIDGEEIAGRDFEGRVIASIGGFVLEGRRPSAWSAIVELLAHLSAERPTFFQRLMRACVALSNGERELDGCDDLLDDRDQQRADLTVDREVRRDREGYLAPAQARAFLQAARTVRLDAARPPIDPIAHAYLRDLAAEPPSDGAAPAAGTGAIPPDAAAAAQQSEAAVAVVMDILADAGVVAPPRALLTAGTPDESRLALVRDFVESHPAAAEELAFLANAMLSGCGVNGRPFAPQDASDVVLATCNLGLENWPSTWAARDLVAAFQIGWMLLHADLCVHAARVLIGVLADLECSDRDVQWSLKKLRRDLARHLADGEPWQSREALEAILVLDAAAWAVLRGLIAECPTLHEVLTQPRLLTVDPAATTFVARNAEIAAARAWLASLASTLTG